MLVQRRKPCGLRCFGSHTPVLSGEMCPQRGYYLLRESCQGCWPSCAPGGRPISFGALEAQWFLWRRKKKKYPRVSLESCTFSPFLPFEGEIWSNCCRRRRRRPHRQEEAVLVLSSAGQERFRHELVRPERGGLARAVHDETCRRAAPQDSVCLSLMHLASLCPPAH